MHAFPSTQRAISGIAFAAALLISALPAAYAQEKVRPEVGKPLQQAQDMLKGKRYKDALAKLREVDGVSGKTPNEAFQIEWTRANAALGAGENDTAAKAFEAVINSGKAPANASKETGSWPIRTETPAVAAPSNPS